MGLIGDILSPVTNLIGLGATRKEGNRARRFAYEMWMNENAYNHPAEQKKRLIEAGLNPSLMYQTMPQNVAESVPQPAYNTGIPHAFNNLAQSLQNSVNASVQNDAIRADTALKLQELEFRKINNPQRIEGNEQDNIAKKLANDFKEIENRYANEFHLLRNKGLTLNIDQLSKAISYMDENQKLFVKEKLGIIAQLAGNVKLMRSQSALNWVMAERTKILSALDSMEIEYRKKGMSFNDSWIFRELKGTFMNLFKGMSEASGKTNNENTIIQAMARAILDALTK